MNENVEDARLFIYIIYKENRGFQKDFGLTFLLFQLYP